MSSNATNAARVLADPDVLAQRRREVFAPHVEPLNQLVEAWRSERPDARIPWFDPAGGGVHARVLVLMEAPGPQTVRDGGSLLSSEDNDDASAATLRSLRMASGLAQHEYVKWNVIPWALLNVDGSWRAPKHADLVDARSCLEALLDILPELEFIVTLGTPALTGYMECVALSPHRYVPVVAAPHPSQRNAQNRAVALRRIEGAFAIAAGRISSDNSLSTPTRSA